MGGDNQKVAGQQPGAAPGNQQQQPQNVVQQANDFASPTPEQLAMLEQIRKKLVNGRVQLKEEDKAVNLNGMRQIENLWRLEIFRCQTSLDGVDRLKTLQELWVIYGNCANFYFLQSAQLDKLLKLNIWGSGLQSIQGIQHLKQLTELVLWDNKLTTIEGVQELPNLQRLGVEKNQLKSFGQVRFLDNLVDLNISENQIECLYPLRNLVKLKSLNAASNRLKAAKDFIYLKDLKEMKFLYVHGNPAVTGDETKLTDFLQVVRTMIGSPYVQLYLRDDETADAAVQDTNRTVDVEKEIAFINNRNAADSLYLIKSKRNQIRAVYQKRRAQVDKPQTIYQQMGDAIMYMMEHEHKWQ